MSSRSPWLAAALVAIAATDAAADVRLENAWLRPVYAGQAAAMIYVDIHSTEALKLVGASTPAAKAAELVLVDPPGAEPEQHRVVSELPVAANGITRLAYLGSHIRITDAKQDLYSGAKVPLELAFVDANGKRRTVATEAVVRGIAARRPAPSADGAPPPK